jgi:hypothetical protein
LLSDRNLLHIFLKFRIFILYLQRCCKHDAKIERFAVNSKFLPNKLLFQYLI